MMKSENLEMIKTVYPQFFDGNIYGKVNEDRNEISYKRKNETHERLITVYECKERTKDRFNITFTVSGIHHGLPYCETIVSKFDTVKEVIKDLEFRL